jgi:2-methylcitrate dehydratase PrpD
MHTKQDSIVPLIEHALRRRFEEIPSPVVKHSLNLLLDTIGCILAGSSVPGVEKVKQTIDFWAGRSLAKVLAFDQWTSTPNAAFLNAVMAHARDYDDTHDRAVNHGCVTIVPALFAVSQTLCCATVIPSQNTELPSRVSGREFVTALVVGLDIANRLGMAFIPYLHVGWLPTTLWGPLAVAAACGRLLGLTQMQMRHALGLAYSQIHGNRQALVDGALAKRIQPAFAAAAGISAVFLALNGVTAAERIIDGDFGIAALYTSGRMDTTALLEGIGRHYETSRVGIKPYPACRCTHPVIDAARWLRNEQGVDWRNIAEGKIFLPPQSMGQIGNPFLLREDPTVDAQFSAQFTAALAFVRDRPQIRDFQPENVRTASDVLKLAARFKPVDFEPHSSTITPVELRIRMTDGSDKVARIEHVKGGPENPLSREELLRKFNDCLDNSIKSYPRDARAILVERILSITSLKNVTELLDIL